MQNYSAARGEQEGRGRTPPIKNQEKREKKERMRGEVLMKVRVVLSAEKELVVPVFKGDSAYEVATRILSSEFSGEVPKNLMRELANMI